MKLLVDKTIGNLDKVGILHVSEDRIISRSEWAKEITKANGWKVKILPTKIANFNLAAKRPFFSTLISEE